MRIGYSKENIKACTKNLKDFEEYLPISGFHGDHIVTGRYTPPADFLYWLNINLSCVQGVFKNYGYFSNNPI